MIEAKLETSLDKKTEKKINKLMGKYKKVLELIIEELVERFEKSKSKKVMLNNFSGLVGTLLVLKDLKVIKVIV